MAKDAKTDLFEWQAAYGATPPYQKHSETSRAAAESVKPTAETRRQEVLAFLKSRGAHGATDEEGQLALAMEGNTYRPRRVELTAAGLVVESAEKRKTTTGRKAVVWKAKS